MKKLFISVLFVSMLLFLAGCVDPNKSEIIIDEIIDVYIDEEYTILPVAYGIEGNIEFIYTSNDEDIFEIEDNIIKPINIGSSELVIRIKDTDIKKIVQVNIIEEIILSFLNYNNILIKEEELALVLLANSKEVSDNILWTSSNLEVATVKAGIVKGLNVGITTITAEYKNKKLSFELNVIEVLDNPITVIGIKDIEIGDFLLLKALINEIEAEFAWISQNEDIVSITNGGIVQGINVGIATIKVFLKSDPRLYLNFKIKVNTPSLHVSMNSNDEIVVGENNRFLIIKDSKGVVVGRHLCVYISNNENIVTISNDGIITAVGVGKATIEVKYNYAVGLLEIEVFKAPEVNLRNLIVEKALSQEGYIEGPNNDTKYGSWYGMPNQAWCAMFVSWCANEIGILNSVIPKYASVQLGLDWFRNKGGNYYKSYEQTQKGEYIPITGDLLFLKSNGASHTAIVIKVVGDILYTIEGNTSDKVALRYYYYKNHDKITGYGIPNYPASSTALKNFDITKATYAGGISTT